VVAVVVRDEACGYCCGLVGEYGEEGAVPEGAAGGGIEEDAGGACAEEVCVCALEGELRCVLVVGGRGGWGERDLSRVVSEDADYGWGEAFGGR
jgi:hypothetical protein